MKVKLVGVLVFIIYSSTYAASDQVPLDRIVTQVSAYEKEVVVHFDPSFSNT